MFHIFNSDAHEAIISPQLTRFESKTFQQIEENIQKEILDYNSCENDDMQSQLHPSIEDNCNAQVDPIDSLQQSTMTNSESPSPKKEEK